jgi:nitrogen fixation protein FixH
VFIILFFVIIGLIDILFIIISKNSYPGTVTDNPYQKGLNYNQVLNKSALQELNEYKIETESSKLSDNKFKYIIVLRKSGLYVSDAEVMVNIVRPLGEYQNFQVMLNNSGNGLYSSEISFPKEGQWEFRVSIIHNSNSIYHKERIIVER